MKSKTVSDLPKEVVDKTSLWQKLPTSQKVSLVMFFLLILILPVTVLASFVKINFFPKAAESPITPPMISPTPIVFEGNRIFVTSTTYSGNLGGLEGADAKCQQRAEATNLGGTWKAWLSIGNSNPENSPDSRFIHSSAPYQLLNGQTIAINWGDLTDGSLQNPINITELKTPKDTAVWSCTDIQGMSKSTTSLQDIGNCNGWTSATVNPGYGGDVGVSSKIYKEWTDSAFMNCNNQFSLYCFEQIDNPVHPAVPTSTPKPTITPIPSPTPTKVPPASCRGCWNSQALCTRYCGGNECKLVTDKNQIADVCGKPASQVRYTVYSCCSPTFQEAQPTKTAIFTR